MILKSQKVSKTLWDKKGGLNPFVVSLENNLSI